MGGRGTNSARRVDLGDGRHALIGRLGGSRLAVTLDRHGLSVLDRHHLAVNLDRRGASGVPLTLAPRDSSILTCGRLPRLHDVSLALSVAIRQERRSPTLTGIADEGTRCTRVQRLGGWEALMDRAAIVPVVDRQLGVAVQHVAHASPFMPNADTTAPKQGFDTVGHGLSSSPWNRGSRDRALHSPESLNAMGIIARRRFGRARYGRSRERVRLRTRGTRRECRWTLRKSRRSLASCCSSIRWSEGGRGSAFGLSARTGIKEPDPRVPLRPKRG